MKNLKIVLQVFAFLALMGLLPACSPSSSFRDPASDNALNDSCDLFFNRTGDCANLIWETVPNGTSNGRFYLEFFRQSDPSVPNSPGYTVDVLEVMPNHSGTAQLVAVQPTGNPGQYFVPNANLAVEGTWEIHVRLKSAQGQVVDEAVMTYNRL